MTDGFLDLTARQFEEAVAGLLRVRGYHAVERVGGAGDLGVDIRCRDGDGRLVVVQCKRYAPTSAISSADIQTFFGMMVHHGAAWGIFVTTSRFTPAARSLAEQRDIRLIDGAELARQRAEQQEAERQRRPQAAREHRANEQDRRLLPSAATPQPKPLRPAGRILKRAARLVGRVPLDAWTWHGLAVAAGLLLQSLLSGGQLFVDDTGGDGAAGWGEGVGVGLFAAVVGILLSAPVTFLVMLVRAIRRDEEPSVRRPVLFALTGLYSLGLVLILLLA